MAMLEQIVRLSKAAVLTTCLSTPAFAQPPGTDAPIIPRSLPEVPEQPRTPPEAVVKNVLESGSCRPFDAQNILKNEKVVNELATALNSGKTLSFGHLKQVASHCYSELYFTADELGKAESSGCGGFPGLRRRRARGRGRAVL